MHEEARLVQLRRRVERDLMSIAVAALAEAYRRSGRPQYAVRVCRTGLMRHPAYSSARLTLSRALLELADVDGAEAQVRDVLHRAPENLAAMRVLAEIQQRRAIAGPTGPPSGSAPNVIPFHAEQMPSELRTSAPALTSLDRLLDAIVTLKRATV